MKLPLYKPNTNYKAQVNLFLYNGHYSTISSFQRFIGGDHQFVCPRCLVGYRNKQCFDSHTERCATLNKNGSTVVMPEAGITEYFEYKKQKRIPIIMVADFEASLEKATVGPKGTTTQHTPNSCTIKILSDIEIGIPTYYSYVGARADEYFMLPLLNLIPK